MRLFIAGKLPDTVLLELVKIQSYLKNKTEKAFFPKIENMHLTLQFIGQVSQTQIPIIYDWFNNLDITNNTKSNCQLSELNYFEQVQGILLWAALKVDPAMQELVCLIKSDLSSMGFKLENKKWLPHITCARRVSVKNNLELMLSKINFSKQQFEIKSIDLIHSEFINSGMRYRSIACR